MELLRISEDKLKVTLLPSDLKKYELQEGKVSYDDEETRRAFRRILGEAKRRIGFTVGKDRVLLQYYPLKEGGGELFVTRIAAGTAKPEKAKKAGKSETVAVEKIFRFSSLTDFLEAARIFSDFPAESSLYYCRGAYYLLIKAAKNAVGTLRAAVGFSDFSQSLPLSVLPYIIEHGKCLERRRALTLFSKF